MKKTYILVLFFLWILFLTGCNKHIYPQENNKEPLNESEKVSTTMMGIFNNWKIVTCTFTMNIAGVPAEWKIYVDGKNMRYSTSGSSQGVDTYVDVIVKDWYSYSWSNLEPNQWYKMKEADTSDEYEDIWAEERVQKTDFNCKKGVPSGIFDLPENINFQEFTYDNSNI